MGDGGAGGADADGDTRPHSVARGRYNAGMAAQTAILQRVFEADGGDLSPDLAQLNLEEVQELDDYLSINSLLSIIQSKARLSPAG